MSIVFSGVLFRKWTWIILINDEFDNLIPFLNKKVIFNYEDGIAEESDTFMGKFFIAQINGSYVCEYYNYATQNGQSVNFPSIDVVIQFCSLENIIGGYAFKMLVLDEHNKTEIMDKLDDACRRCITSPMHLKCVATHNADSFVVELSTNFFSFFLSILAHEEINVT